MHTVRDLIHHNRVLDLGPLPAPRLASNSTIQQALQFLARGRRGAIVVMEGTRPVGIFTERDVVNRLSTGMTPEYRRSTSVGEVMSRPPVTVRRRASLAEAIETMAKRRHRHLVVVDGDGNLQGLLTSNDLVQFLTDQFPEDTVNLPPRLHQTYDSVEGA